MKKLKIKYFYDTFYFPDVMHFDLENCIVKYNDSVDKCPVSILGQKNTYYYKSPFDLTIDYQNDTVFIDSTKSSVEYSVYSHVIDPPLINDITNEYAVLQYNLQLVLFLEGKMDLMLVEHQVDLGNGCRTLDACFNIGRWNRPMNVPIIIPKDSSLHIKRGDTLFKFTLIDTKNSAVELSREDDEQKVFFEKQNKIRKYNNVFDVYKNKMFDILQNLK